MSQQSDGVVVIGAGLAAANLVAALRDQGHHGPIALVGDEGELPYERPPLSKGVLTGDKQPDSVYVHDRQWYADHSVDLHLDDAAVAIDRKAQQVRLESGGTLPYDRLVLATGASARTLPIPGTDLSGVHTLRTVADNTALREAFAQGKRLVVIGAGWIGLEVAAAARQAGLDVTVLEYAPVPLQTSMGEQLGSHFADVQTGHGVRLRTGASVEAIEGKDGRVTGVRAGGTTYDADLVVIGVGATPNTALAEDAGLTVDNGVVVDSQLRSSDPQILAIGDVANADNTELGRLRVEHWDNAIKQGKLAAKVILGGSDRYDWQPYFYTDQFDLGMEYVGRAAPDDDVVIRGDRSSGEFIAFWLRDASVTAAMNVNVWDVNDDLRALIGRKVDPARLADTAVDLGDLATD